VTDIFVFGSNEAGRHGKGAAKKALEQYGAIYGKGVGLQGRSYAIPTKGQDTNRRLYTLPLDAIKKYVDDFIEFANETPGNLYWLTPIGCGLAGYTPKDIGPLFDGAPANIILPQEFRPFAKKRGYCE